MLGGSRPRVLTMMLAMAVGVGALMLVICVGQGTKKEVLDIVARQGLDLLQIRPGTDRHTGLPSGDRSVVSLIEPDVDAITQQIGNIELVGPVMDQKRIDVKHGDKFTQTRIFGVTPEWEFIRDFGPRRGEFISEEDLSRSARVCLIGQTVKKNLFGDADPIGQTIRIKDVPFVVKGELSYKGISAAGRNRDDRIVVPITTFSRRLFKQIHLTQIVITVSDTEAVGATVEELRHLLRQRHRIPDGAPDDFAMRTPRDLIDLAYGARKTVNNLLTGISVVALLVAGIVASNVMLISVSARRSEVGVRRALGATGADIRKQFLIESLLIAWLGGLLGALLASIVGFALSSVGVATIRVSAMAFGISIASCTAIAVASALYPAKRAASVDPVQALRA